MKEEKVDVEQAFNEEMALNAPTGTEIISESINGIDIAKNNYLEIVNKNLPYKFEHLENWLETQSGILLDEAILLENSISRGEMTLKIRKRATFKRGTIIKVDFGVNLGAEMSQIHFAIVLTKNDNPLLDNLTVVPLTSTISEFHLPLAYDIFGELKDKVEPLKDTYRKDMKTLRRQLSERTISNNQFRKQCTQVSCCLNEIDDVIRYYANHQKQSNVAINQVCTISKSKILKPLNSFDILEKERCPSYELDRIDEEIMKRFTNVDVDEYKNFMDLKKRFNLKLYSFIKLKSTKI